MERELSRKAWLHDTRRNPRKEGSHREGKADTPLSSEVPATRWVVMRGSASTELYSRRVFWPRPVTSFSFLMRMR